MFNKYDLIRFVIVSALLVLVYESVGANPIISHAQVDKNVTDFVKEMN